MFQSLVAAVAAFTLGGAMFQCPMCGKKHDSRKEAWLSCLRRASTYQVPVRRRAVYLGKYIEANMDEDVTRLRIPAVGRHLVWPRIVNYKIPFYEGDVKIFAGLHKEIETAHYEAVEEFNAVEGKLCDCIVPLEWLVPEEVLEEYVKGIILGSQAFKTYIDSLKNAVTKLSELGERFQHLFTMSPPPVDMTIEKVFKDGYTQFKYTVDDKIYDMHDFCSQLHEFYGNVTDPLGINAMPLGTKCELSRGAAKIHARPSIKVRDYKTTYFDGYIINIYISNCHPGSFIAGYIINKLAEVTELPYVNLEISNVYPGY